jgi:hypothetical protein
MSLRTFGSLASVVVAICAGGACGGGQAPAESPEMSAEPSESTPAASEPASTEPADTADAGTDTHTMPDGTTMPGAEHGEGAGEHQH